MVDHDNHTVDAKPPRVRPRSPLRGTGTRIDTTKAYEKTQGLGPRCSSSATSSSWSWSGSRRTTWSRMGELSKGPVLSSSQSASLSCLSSSSSSAWARHDELDRDAEWAGSTSARPPGRADAAGRPVGQVRPGFRLVVRDADGVGAAVRRPRPRVLITALYAAGIGVVASLILGAARAAGPDRGDTELSGCSSSADRAGMPASASHDVARVTCR